MNFQKHFIILLIALLYITTSCTPYQRDVRKEKQRRKELVKLQEDRQNEAEKLYEEAMKKHYAMQTKKTKRMMKSTASKSRISSGEKKEPLYNRLFKRKKIRKLEKEREGL